VRAEIDQAITQLGSADYPTREAAYRKLAGFGGKAFRQLLEASKNGSDAEIRRRCSLLLSGARTEDFEARVAAFLADHEGKYSHELPGWALYSQKVGTTPAARQFLADLLKDPATQRLLIAAEADPNGIPIAVQARAMELQQRQYRPAVLPPPGLIIRPVQRELAPGQAATAKEMLGIYFVDCLAPETATARRPGIGPTTFLYQASLRQVMTAGDETAAIAKNIMAFWIETRQPGSTDLYSGMVAASNWNGMEDIVYRAAERILATKAVVAYQRGQAVGMLARTGKEKALPVLEKLLTDETQAGVRVEATLDDDGKPVQKQYTIQTRDVALAMLIRAAGKNPTEFGFTVYTNSSEAMRYTPTNQWFKSDADRDAAFKKWAEFRKDPAKK
jgi:hypothetical protein